MWYNALAGFHFESAQVVAIQFLVAVFHAFTLYNIKFKLLSNLLHNFLNNINRPSGICQAQFVAYRFVICSCAVTSVFPEHQNQAG